MYEALLSVLTAMANMFKGAYAFSQSTFGDFITISVLSLLALLLFKMILDGMTRMGQTAARTAEASSNIFGSASNMFMVVILVGLMLLGAYKSDGISGFSGKMKDGEAELRIDKSTAPGFENFRNPLKEPSVKLEASNPIHSAGLLSDEELIQYYFFLADSARQVENQERKDFETRKEKESKEKSQKDSSDESFWDKVERFNEKVEGLLGFDGNFNRKKSKS